MKRFVVFVTLCAVLAGSAMADTKASKEAKKACKSKQECCVEQQECCKGMKRSNSSKSSSEQKQEKKESGTPESK